MGTCNTTLLSAWYLVKMSSSLKSKVPRLVELVLGHCPTGSWRFCYCFGICDLRRHQEWLKLLYVRRASLVSCNVGCLSGVFELWFAPLQELVVQFTIHTVKCQQNTNLVKDHSQKASAFLWDKKKHRRKVSKVHHTAEML